MNYSPANYIVFLFLFLIIVGLLFIINILMDAYVWGVWLNRMKNSSGNYNVTKILLMVSAGIALYFLLSYLLKPKQTVRASLSRSQE
jgi:formate-dependent nitrite reductase membrane component NrfD